MSIWKKIKYKKYIDNGEEVNAPIEKQMEEILNHYNDGTVLISSMNNYGYERVEVLTLKDYVFLSESNALETELGSDFNKACVLSNDLHSAEYYMCVDSPFKK